MEILHILKILKRSKAIALLIILQIAITLAIVSNSVFITANVLDNWLIEANLDEHEIINIWTTVYDENLDQRQLLEDDLKRLTAIPGVNLATPTIEHVLETNRYYKQVFNSVDENAQAHELGLFDTNLDGPEILGVEIISGRALKPLDLIQGNYLDIQQTAPNVLVSEDMAKSLFPEGNALGNTFYITSERVPAKIVGIYNNIMLGEEAVYGQVEYHSVIRPQVKYGQNALFHYMVRIDPNQGEEILQKIEDVLYEQPGRYVQGVEFAARAKKRLWDGRSSFAFTMLGISFIGLCITAMGIVGLVTFSVSLRKKEIGTKRALGATKGQIIRYFLIENSILAFMGMILGIILSLYLNLLLIDRFNISGLIQLDYCIYIACFIWSICLMAVYIPARKAANIAPAIITRGLA
jgi:putative ABC transport system permease protein